MYIFNTAERARHEYHCPNAMTGDRTCIKLWLPKTKVWEKQLTLLPNIGHRISIAKGANVKHTWPEAWRPLNLSFKIMLVTSSELDVSTASCPTPPINPGCPMQWRFFRKKKQFGDKIICSSCMSLNQFYTFSWTLYLQNWEDLDQISSPCLQFSQPDTFTIIYEVIAYTSPVCP